MDAASRVARAELECKREDRSHGVRIAFNMHALLTVEVISVYVIYVKGVSDTSGLNRFLCSDEKIRPYLVTRALIRFRISQLYNSSRIQVFHDDTLFNPLIVIERLKKVSKLGARNSRFLPKAFTRDDQRKRILSVIETHPKTDR